MASATRPPVDAGASGVAPQRSDRSPWNWLLLVPIVVVLLVPLYNHVDPTFGSWPLFYWLQLAFVAHTNADRAPDHGVNAALAAVLGLRDAVPLEPADGDPRAGLGRVGELDRAMPLREFAALAARVLPATVGGVRAAGDPERIVRRVAVCGGSGGSLTGAAAAAGADVFLTSDLKHHPVSESLESTGPALCDVGHFATEWPWLPVAADVLHRDLSGRVEVAVSRRRTDPWTWHEGSNGVPAGRSAG